MSFLFLYNKNRLVKSLWGNFFKEPFDEVRFSKWTALRGKLRAIFFKFEWYEVYDFLEFIVYIDHNQSDIRRNDDFIKDCNIILTGELSGYRFGGTKVDPITL